MKSPEQNQKSSVAKKRQALAIVVCLLIAICGVAYYVSNLNYEKKKADILNAENINLTSWVQGTIQAMSIWVESIDEQGQRISNSDSYRGFIEDVRLAGSEVASEINTSDIVTSQLDSNYDELIDQVPFWRSALYDYMNNIGMFDARIVNGEGVTILSALQIPTAITPTQAQTVKKSIDTNKISISPVRTSASTMVIDYALPILPFVYEENDPPIAAVLFTLPITNQIAQFLSRDIHAETQTIPYIIQKNGETFQNIQIHTPKPTDITTKLDFNSSQVLPFGLRTSVNGTTQVYSYAEKVPELDMWVVLELPADVITSTFTSMAWTIYGLGALASIGVILLFAMIWWMMIGKEQREAAEKFRKLYDVIAQQKGLLDSINLSLEVGLIMIDTDGKIKISNKTFNEIVDKDEEGMVDASLLSVFEGQVAGIFMDKVDSVVANDTHLTFEVEIPKSGSAYLYRVTLYPFHDDYDDGVDILGAVATLQDITEFRRNSEKNKKQQANIIQAFVRAIEGVDPYLTGHSQMMSNVGILMAKHMGMNEEEISTIHNASIFSQVGKLFIDREILIKTGKLTEEELAKIKQLPEKAYEVLSGIGFSAPIATAVRQMYEQLDGNGYPNKLTDGDIIIPARILAITNSFCALISERSFRAGLPISEAIARLKESPNKFDSELLEVLTEVIKTPEGATALTVDKD